MTRRVLRAWLVGAVRQGHRAVVVVLTLVVMSVGTGAALVAADSLEQLFVADARAQWPDVDLEVTNHPDGVFSLQRARFVAVEGGQAARGWSPRLVLPAVLSAGERTEPDGLVLGLPAEDQSFPPLEAVEGTANWLALGAGEVLVNARLARRLGLGVGDDVDLVIGIPQVVLRDEADDRIRQIRRATSVSQRFRIAGVVADRHAADLHRTPNVILRQDHLARLVHLDGQVNVLHLGARDDEPSTARQLQREVDAIARVFDLDTDPVLQDELAIADDEGGQFRSILLMLAILVVVAAAIATAQMLTSLAEDRSDEIAVLRTLGLRQRVVRRLVATEAVLYAALAAAIGLWLSIPVADALSTALADHFAALSAGRGREQVQLVATHDPATLATGAVIVLVTALLSGRAAGRRLAEADVDELLRGPLDRLPERPLGPRRPMVLALLGSMVVGMGLLGGPASDALRFTGLTLLGVGQWTWARRKASGDERPRVDQRHAVAALVWSTVGAALLADFGQGFETGFGILVVAGMLSVAAATGLLVTRFRQIVRLLRLYAPSGAWQVALRTAGAYAQESRGGSARIHATFGIVLFLAAALHVLGNAQQLPVARQAGGFDVIARSVVGVDPPQLRRLDGVGRLVAMPSSLVPEDAYGARPAGVEDGPLLELRYPVRVTAATLDLAAAQAFELADALPGYPDATAALQAAATSSDKVVVDRYALPPGARVGDDIVFEVGSDERRYELIAVLDTFLLDAAFVNLEEFSRLVPAPGANFVLASADGVTPSALLATLESSERARGLTGDTVADAAADVVAVNRTFTDVFALMLLLGLAVAVVAVAASLARSARERTRVLAVLRVIGLPRWALAITLAAEPVVVAVVGSLTGLGVGLGVLRALFLVGFDEYAFVVDPSRVGAGVGALVALLVATCVATAWPASRVAPADHAR